MRNPVIKFMGVLYSYFVFVAMVIVYVLIETPSAGYTLSEHPDVGPIFKVFDPLIITSANFWVTTTPTLFVADPKCSKNVQTLI